MKYQKISHLYKFYKYDAPTLSDLKSRAFWFSKPDSLNDPFDGKISFDNRFNSEDLKRFLPRYRRYNRISEKQAKEKTQYIINKNGQVDTEFDKIWSNILKEADEKLRNSGVFCLSECDSSILMWSHYADNHKGFCVEFVRGPQNAFGDYGKTRPVRYRPDYPIISPLNPKAYDFKFYRKATDWGYEKEWRLWNTQGDIAVPLSVEISALIFGLNMAEPHKLAIKQIVPNVQYRRCTIALNQFGLKIVDL